MSVHLGHLDAVLHIVIMSQILQVKTSWKHRLIVMKEQPPPAQEGWNPTAKKSTNIQFHKSNFKNMKITPFSPQAQAPKNKLVNITLSD